MGQLFIAREQEQETVQNFVLPLRGLALSYESVLINLALLFSLVRLFLSERLGWLFLADLDHAIHVSHFDWQSCSWTLAGGGRLDFLFALVQSVPCVFLFGRQVAGRVVVGRFHGLVWTTSNEPRGTPRIGHRRDLDWFLGLQGCTVLKSTFFNVLRGANRSITCVQLSVCRDLILLLVSGDEFTLRGLTYHFDLNDWLVVDSIWTHVEQSAIKFSHFS